MVKPVRFCGSSGKDLRGFPREARHEMGYQIDRVQHGGEPHDCKPMKTVGPSVREIRVAMDGQGFRAIYIATLGETIYVLHCFEKKTRKTPKKDIDLAKSRLSELMKEIRG